MSEALEEQVDLQRDFCAVFSTPAGERVLAAIMAACGMKSLMAAADPCTLGIQAGAKNVGTWILNTMNRDLSDLPVVRRNPPRRQINGQ